MINCCLSRVLDELQAGGVADPLGHRLDLATLRDTLDRLAEGRDARQWFHPLCGALLAVLRAEEVPDPLHQPLTLAAVWADLACLSGEAPPAVVAARLGDTGLDEFERAPVAPSGAAGTGGDGASGAGTGPVLT